jgi:hypothetical protein
VTSHVGVMVALGSNGRVSIGIATSNHACIVYISVVFADAKGIPFPLRACL